MSAMATEDHGDRKGTTGATETASALEVTGLTISYRQRGRLLRVVDDVSFRINPGEAYGLVGESGCGKTTIAMAVMRYLAPNAVIEKGSIVFDGKDLLLLSQAALRRWRGNRMAMVYQDPGSALNPAMRVGQQIAEVYRYHLGMSKRKALEASAAMLERVQISDPERVLNRYPHELSGGQQQRIMFAMALATDPDLLVLDEPTTGLDATVEAEVLDLVEQLRTQFRSSILFISHNLAIVARLCERVGVLYAGRIIEEGPAGRLFSEPRHPYTLGLLRCVPTAGMNKHTRPLDPIPGSLPPPGTKIDGCNYAERCPIARERCRQELPPLLKVEERRSTRCFFHTEVPDIPFGWDKSRPSYVDDERQTSNDEVLLRVDDLVKAYQSGRHQVIAVADVSFEVHRGEVFGLVGESGSGKTSLAKCIVGLTDATTGTIEFGQGVLPAGSYKRSRELRRKVQMVFQNPDGALNPSHTVRRILQRALKLLAGSVERVELDRRLTRLASDVKLEQHYLDVRPTALSGGQKQRVAIGRAFAGSPSLVLCDEPVSALDVSVQAAILNLLVDLQRRGVSYLFISHDLAVVRYIADRIGVMYLGWLVEVGPAEAVFDVPHHPYTEALLSAAATLGSDQSRANGHQSRIRLRGTMPSPSNPPSGCRFHTRCPLYLGDICRLQEPPWHTTAAGNQYRCHIPPDELKVAELRLRQESRDVHRMQDGAIYRTTTDVDSS
jgi:peptide/nickel transport system ATP-binding protein